MNILSSSIDKLDDESQAYIRQPSNFQKIADLMHNELMSASHISRKFNNSSQLDQVKESVVSLLRLMKDVPDFASFFIQDLFSRAESTLKKLSQNEFDGIMEITVSSYREKMEGVVSLDPYNLLIFR